MYDFCQITYLTPMTIVGISKRLGKKTTKTATDKFLQRIKKILKACDVKLSVQDEEGRRPCSFSCQFFYYICDPYWRDKLEEVYQTAPR